MENQEQQNEKPATNNMTMIILAAVAGIIVLGGLGFVLNKPVPTEKSSKAINETEGTPTAENAQVISVEGGSYYFKPNEIRVKVNQPVKIELKSVSMMHDFVIDEFNVKTPIIQSGNTGEVEFTPDKTGTFEFYCSVGNHRQMGMVGKLIVE